MRQAVYLITGILNNREFRDRIPIEVRQQPGCLAIGAGERDKVGASPMKK
jgi:hypothetical protein